MAILRSGALPLVLVLGLFVWAQGEEADDSSPEDEEEPDGASSEEDVMMAPLTEAQMLTIHSKADKNADGKVSLQEILSFSTEMNKEIAKQGVDSAMSHMDGNSDGALDFQEISAAGEEPEEDKAAREQDEDEQAVKDQEEARFRAADVNGDSLLQPAELPAFFYPETDDGALTLAAAATMEAKDADLDGKLTVKEFWEGGDIQGGSGGVPITAEEREDFKKLDADKDNLIDLAELKVWESGYFESEKTLRALIELADKDGDKHLTHAELSSESEKISQSDAQHTVMEWALHLEL